MTMYEARKILGLKDHDEYCKNGLEYLKKIARQQLNNLFLPEYERKKLTTEIQAINVLLNTLQIK